MLIPGSWALLAYIPMLFSSAHASAKSTSDVKPTTPLGLTGPDISYFVPKVSLDIDGIKLYPAAPEDKEWLFITINGDVCSLKYSMMCCSDDCIDIPDTIDAPANITTAYIGRINVGIKQRDIEPVTDAEAQDFLSAQAPLNDAKTSIVEDATKAAGKMFEFALMVLSHRSPKNEAAGQEKPFGPLDALSEAVAAVDKVLPDSEDDFTVPISKPKTLTQWVHKVDQLALAAFENHEITLDVFGIRQSSQLRAMVNRMRWFRSIGDTFAIMDLVSPSRNTKLLARMILHDLGADERFMGSHFTQFNNTGGAGSITHGINAFAGHAQLYPRDSKDNNATTPIPNQNRGERKTWVHFKPGTPAPFVETFYQALDLAEGYKLPGFPELGASYFTKLSRRQRAMIGHMKSISFVHEQLLQDSNYRGPRNSSSTLDKDAMDRLWHMSHHDFGNQTTATNRVLDPREITDPGPDNDADVVTQRSAPYHLLRISETRNPLFANSYRYHKSAGEGTWVYVVDSGYAHHTREVREELRVDENNIQDSFFEVPLESCVDTTLNLPEQKINRAPDVDRDYNWQGHGTPAASLAVGTTYGVAKKAKMFSIKVFCNWIQYGEWRTRTSPEALLIGANKMFERHREYGHTGKAVMLVPMVPAVVIGSELAEQYTAAWRTILLACRHAGIVVVTSAAAHGPYLVVDDGPDDCFWRTSAADGMIRFPETLAGEFPEMIVVGAAGLDGTYRIQNSRIMDDNQDWVFAHGYPIEGMTTDGSVRNLIGDMWAAPIVGGLVAYYLAHPHWGPLIYGDEANMDVRRIGARVKEILKGTAWRRYEYHKEEDRWSDFILAYEDDCNNLLDLIDEYPGIEMVPDEVLMVSNAVAGIQNACYAAVPPDTNNGPPDMGNIYDDDDDDDDEDDEDDDGDKDDEDQSSNSDTGNNRKRNPAQDPPADPLAGLNDTCARAPPAWYTPKSTATPAPLPTNLADWEDVGCIDLPDDNLAGLNTTSVNGGVDLDKCAKECACSHMFAARNGDTCTCIKDPVQLLGEVVDGKLCGVPCSNNGQQMCGGEGNITRVYLSLVGVDAEDERCAGK